MPGIYRQKVGNILFTCITDGAVSFPRTDNFVLNVPPAEVEEALKAAFLPTDHINLPFSPVVLETAGRVVVVDTGVGEAALKASKGVGGQFHTNLRAAGYSAGAVDQVLITHFHADHIGGLITQDGTSAFPNAQIMVPAAEYEFWMDKGNAGRAETDVIRANFERAQRFMGILKEQVHQYEPGKEIVPGVTAISTPGHTPGHSSFIVSSESRKVVIQGDVTNYYSLFVDHPGWHVWSDMYPVTAEQTRRKLYDTVASEQLLLHGFHFNFPPLGHLTKAGEGYRYVPVAWDAYP
ncbi:MBL fold metallo-hydrolase [Azorhizobium caulinodans]|uniref:MBL fold metallo-hydrolase n=1 Tax=Azorhizobium caulinodans TaxID=7 RepID=UPI002FBE7167